ncbi:protein bicaudal C homolog 1-like [Punica granatum]|uniref:SAM domain-containing protein n=2 Tax=Punica granatum TaxID=22663 RepID=A0A218VY39_PUNGR|nr:protein bicaudal C homolog 1-like [Punica granatum]OWM65199.1 hypothetical protein CDL15_Pgr008788 [Punica granatum]PKI31451.1 hypothetical protein CRG98_048164 [Punica granatum]
MLVLSMNSKRQRRPSIRLGEVGDVPAASACWFSQATREFLTRRSWEDDFIPAQEVADGPSRDKIQPEFAGAGHGIHPHASTTDMLQNIENKNPNSSKSHYGFGAITRKTRGPRGQNVMGIGLVAASCGSLPSPGANTRDGAEFSGRESSGGARIRGNCCYRDGSGGHGQGQDRSCVRKWLEERGFGEYVDVFEMHEVDEEALPLLTFTDLKEMGVFAVGHRRKLYNAIRQLRCDP